MRKTKNPFSISHPRPRCSAVDEMFESFALVRQINVSDNLQPLHLLALGGMYGGNEGGDGDGAGGGGGSQQDFTIGNFHTIQTEVEATSRVSKKKTDILNLLGCQLLRYW